MRFKESVKMCRICLEETGNLVGGICKCKGMIHNKCLLKVQKYAILNQSTNPKFQTKIESFCLACNSTYSKILINRHKLMSSFTGTEIQELIKTGSFIISTKEGSKKNEKIIEKHKDNINLVNNLNMWTFAVYIIIDTPGNKDNQFIYAVDLTKPIPKMIDIFKGLNSEVINVKKIWKKYEAIDKIPWLDIKYFQSGPIFNKRFYSLLFIQRFKQLPKNIIILAEENNNLIIAGFLMELYNIAKFYFENIKREKLKIFIFASFAGWSRGQLVSECAIGSWAFCKASYNDFKLESNIMWSKIYNLDKTINIPKNEFIEFNN